MRPLFLNFGQTLLCSVCLFAIAGNWVCHAIATLDPFNSFATRDSSGDIMVNIVALNFTAPVDTTPLVIAYSPLASISSVIAHGTFLAFEEPTRCFGLQCCYAAAFSAVFNETNVSEILIPADITTATDTPFFLFISSQSDQNQISDGLPACIQGTSQIFFYFDTNFNTSIMPLSNLSIVLPQTANVNDPVSMMTTLGSGALSAIYKWDFGDGHSLITNQTVVQYQFNTTGTFNINVTVTNLFSIANMSNNSISAQQPITIVNATTTASSASVGSTTSSPISTSENVGGMGTPTVIIGVLASVLGVALVGIVVTLVVRRLHADSKSIDLEQNNDSGKKRYSDPPRGEPVISAVIHSQPSQSKGGDSEPAVLAFPIEHGPSSPMSERKKLQIAEKNAAKNNNKNSNKGLGLKMSGLSTFFFNGSPRSPATNSPSQSPSVESSSVEKRFSTDGQFNGSLGIGGVDVNENKSSGNNNISGNSPGNGSLGKKSGRLNSISSNLLSVDRKRRMLRSASGQKSSSFSSTDQVGVDLQQKYQQQQQQVSGSGASSSVYHQNDSIGRRDQRSGSHQSGMDENNEEDDEIPLIVQRCVAYLMKKGIQEEGIFRVPGSFKEITEIKTAFARGHDPHLDKILDPQTVAGVLKLYLRDNFLLDQGIAQMMVDACKHDKSRMETTQILRSCLQQLPRKTFFILRTVMFLLATIASNSQVNFMSAPILARVIGPSIFKDVGMLVGKCSSS